MARSLNNLSAKEVKAASAPGKYGDGGGLYLVVDDAGAKRWLFIYQIKGRRREMGLGSAAVVSLADARDRRDEAKRLIAQGLDPIEVRKQEATPAEEARAPFFGEYAQKVADNRPLKRELTRTLWKVSVGPKGAPLLQSLRVDEVTTEHVLKTLQPDWQTKPTKARKIRERIEIVLDSAKAEGLIPDPWANPARWKGHLQILLGKQRHRTQHFAALAYEKVGDFMQRLREEKGVAARMLEFTVLTAGRSVEARKATWGNIDLDAKLWMIPGADMKMDKPHLVTLSDQAVKVLRSLIPPGATPDPLALVFPSRDGRRKGQMLCHRAMTAVMERMGHKNMATPHGFRSTFRDWAGDKTGYAREVIEACLSHAVGDETERSYRRRDALEKRAKLMQEWADRCDSVAQDEDVVVPFRPKEVADAKTKKAA